MTSEFSLPLSQSGLSRAPCGPDDVAVQVAEGSHMFPAAAAFLSLQRLCGLFWRPGGASWAELSVELRVNEEQTPLAARCSLSGLLTLCCQYLLRVFLEFLT